MYSNFKIAVNRETGEIKLFDSLLTLRNFLMKNHEWKQKEVVR